MQVSLHHSRLAELFGSRSGTILVACTVAGDPDYATSVRIIREMEASGADCIELVMPFSDPVADGPVMQEAVSRALDAGMNTDRFFSLIREIRKGSEIPLVILTYANILIQRGIDSFYQDAANAGADGVAVADVPLEESGPFLYAARGAGIDPVLFVSQTTSGERLLKILSGAGGFIYLVAAMGVTGVRDEISRETILCLQEVKKRTALPVVPGFGISSPEHIRTYGDSGADGVIVGSALAKKIAELVNHGQDPVQTVGELVRELKSGCIIQRGI
jgi:tryptophan synthase alpha chain